jgi:hypothetical protein
MKIKPLGLFAIALALFLNTGCHKCVECTETNSAGGNHILWPEVCGKKKVIDDYRKYMESIVDPGNKVQCTERKTTLF